MKDKNKKKKDVDKTKNKKEPIVDRSMGRAPNIRGAGHVIIDNVKVLDTYEIYFAKAITVAPFCGGQKASVGEEILHPQACNQLLNWNTDGHPIMNADMIRGSCGAAARMLGIPTGIIKTHVFYQSTVFNNNGKAGNENGIRNMVYQEAKPVHLWSGKSGGFSKYETLPPGMHFDIIARVPTKNITKKIFEKLVELAGSTQGIGAYKHGVFGLFEASNVEWHDILWDPPKFNLMKNINLYKYILEEGLPQQEQLMNDGELDIHQMKAQIIFLIHESGILSPMDIVKGIGRIFEYQLNINSLLRILNGYMADNCLSSVEDYDNNGYQRRHYKVRSISAMSSKVVSSYNIVSKDQDIKAKYEEWAEQRLD